MAGGSCTVTPGKTWNAEAIDDTKLNQTATPAVVVDDNSIGEDQLDIPSVTGPLAAAIRGNNFFLNPSFTGERWAAGSVSPAIAAVAYNAAGWYATPAGAAITYDKLEDAPVTGVDDYKARYCAKLSGATSVTTVDFGQFIPARIASQFRGGNFVASIYLKNQTEDDLTLLCRLDVCATEDDPSSAVNDTSVAQAIVTAGSGWTRVSQVIDGSAVVNIQKGFTIYWRAPSGHLDTASKNLRYTLAQLEIAETVTNLVQPAGELNVLAAASKMFQASDPGPANTEAKGYLPGAQWHTASGIFDCLASGIWVKRSGLVDVKTANKTDSGTTTGNTYAGIAGISVTITPKSTASRIVLFASLHLEASGDRLYFRYHRDVSDTGLSSQGNWDASSGVFPGAGAATVNQFWVANVAGTVDSQAFLVGDEIVATVANASTVTFAGNWNRHTSYIALGDQVGTSRERVTGSIRQLDATHPRPEAVLYIDSPATTQAITYSVRWRMRAAAAGFINQGSSDTDADTSARSLSSITAMEILV